MVNVHPPKVPEPRTEMLTADQMKALLAGCSGRDFGARRDTAIIALFADTGMRRAGLAEKNRACSPPTESGLRVIASDVRMSHDVANVLETVVRAFRDAPYASFPFSGGTLWSAAGRLSLRE